MSDQGSEKILEEYTESRKNRRTRDCCTTGSCEYREFTGGSWYLKFWLSVTPITRETRSTCYITKKRFTDGAGIWQ